MTDVARTGNRPLRVTQLLKLPGSRGHGNGIATERLHDELRRQGVDSRILCQSASQDSPYQVLIPRRRLIEGGIRRITKRLGLNDIHAVSAFAVPNLDVIRESDVVHIHSLHSDYFSYLGLPALTAAKPTLLSIHDSWAMTGHCAITLDCERWKTGCGHCPYLDIHPPAQRDATSLEWRIKKRVYDRAQLSIIVPSQWMEDRVRQSMLGRFGVYRIPYGVDTAVFQPLDRQTCRKALGLPSDAHVLLFVAMDIRDRLKGGDLLIDALQRLPEHLASNTVLLLLGRNSEAFRNHIRIPVVDLGYVESDRLKALAYSAADLFLFPTRQDVLGLVVIESLACGTPVVAFAAGGVVDTVTTGDTGYLARPEDAADFASGVVSLLEQPASLATLRRRARQVAEEHHSLELQARRTTQLYLQLAGMA